MLLHLSNDVLLKCIVPRLHRRDRASLSCVCTEFRDTAFGAGFTAWWCETEGAQRELYMYLAGHASFDRCSSFFSKLAAEGTRFEGPDEPTRLELVYAPSNPSHPSTHPAETPSETHSDPPRAALGTLLTRVAEVLPGISRVYLDIGDKDHVWDVPDWARSFLRLEKLMLASVDLDLSALDLRELPRLKSLEICGIDANLHRIDDVTDDADIKPPGGLCLPQLPEKLRKLRLQYIDADPHTLFDQMGEIHELVLDYLKYDVDFEAEMADPVHHLRVTELDFFQTSPSVFCFENNHVEKITIRNDLLTVDDPREHEFYQELQGYGALRELCIDEGYSSRLFLTWAFANIDPEEPYDPFGTLTRLSLATFQEIPDDFDLSALTGLERLDMGTFSHRALEHLPYLTSLTSLSGYLPSSDPSLTEELLREEIAKSLPSLRELTLNRRPPSSS